jgi:hypothetical protein
VCDDWDGHGESEYLIKAWKRVWKSLRNTEAVGAVTVEDAKDCRKHWELGIAESVGAWMEGNQLAGIGKGQDLLVENRHKQWDLLATHSGCGCSMRCMSENCNSITNPEVLFHTG